VVVHPETVTDEEMAGFGWITFKENVAIALAVAGLLGVNRSSALAGMWSAPPDPGVLEVKRYLVTGKLLRVANVFAANDPQSTLMNVRRLLTSKAIGRPLHLVINCRPDRIERNGQMGELVADIEPERIVLIGTPTRSARVAIPQNWHDRIVDLGGTRDALELVAEIVGGIDEQASLVAIGNIHGQGELLLEQLATLPEAPTATVREPRDRPLDRDRPRPTPYRRDVAARSRQPQPNAAMTQPLPRIRHRSEP
jgi:gamma-polyglutamate synthase